MCTQVTYTAVAASCSRLTDLTHASRMVNRSAIFVKLQTVEVGSHSYVFLHVASVVCVLRSQMQWHNMHNTKLYHMHPKLCNYVLYFRRYHMFCVCTCSYMCKQATYIVHAAWCAQLCDASHASKMVSTPAILIEIQRFEVGTQTPILSWLLPCPHTAAPRRCLHNTNCWKDHQISLRQKIPSLQVQGGKWKNTKISLRQNSCWCKRREEYCRQFLQVRLTFDKGFREEIRSLCVVVQCPEP